MKAGTNFRLRRFLEHHSSTRLRDTLWVGLAAVVLLSGWVAFSYFEARAFNRIVGADATTWEAMWVNLRVSEAPK